MPLGFERLNERTQRPNAHINFIKPLPGPSSATAEAILSRVAAICYPFMKSHMILVQALEEFPYNTEFVGRNFNAGEVIQLVLKDRRGRWLPQKMVEMVMVHELAHCREMNHSRAFWKVRDQYAEELRGLWMTGYTGEGMWGRGRDLQSGGVQSESVDPGDVPEHLCGGTYRRKKAKRRRGGAKGKEELSYAERKQRRILRKFGAGGQALGADDAAKVKLEGGVVKKGKPRVAGSARGRELRAAAALARFEAVKKEPEVKEEEASSDSEAEDEDEYNEVQEEAAIDVDGKKMTDDRGRALVKICEDEDNTDDNARRELAEIHCLEAPKKKQPAKPFAPLTSSKQSTSGSPTAAAPKTEQPPKLSPPVPPQKGSPSKPPAASAPKPASQTAANLASRPPVPHKSSAHIVHLDEIYKRRAELPDPLVPAPTTLACAVCSLLNEPGSLTCVACSNVLNPDFAPDHWRCRSTACQRSAYVNSGDVGRCGICGAAKQPSW